VVDWAFLFVTVGAIAEAGVVEVDRLPVRCADVTSSTTVQHQAISERQFGPGLSYSSELSTDIVLVCLDVVFRGRVVRVTGAAFHNTDVLERRGGPGIGVVAVVAGAGKVIGVDRTIGGRVTALAVLGDIRVAPFDVAIQAVNLRVFALQRVEVVVIDLQL
jgi:hypothetical protein